MHRLLTYVVVIALIGLAGCGSPRPIKYYAVQVPAAPSPSSAAYPIDLVVKRLAGSSLLEATPMIYRSGPNQMGTYAYHRWEDAPVEIVQAKLIRMLRGTGQYQSVGDAASTAGADFVVRGRLYDFEEVSGSGIAGQVTMEFELYERKTGKVLWTHYYSQTEPAGGKEVADVVQALERNLDRGLKEVIAGMGQYFAANPPKQAQPTT